MIQQPNLNPTNNTNNINIFKSQIQLLCSSKIQTQPITQMINHLFQIQASCIEDGKSNLQDFVSALVWKLNQQNLTLNQESFVVQAFGVLLENVRKWVYMIGTVNVAFLLTDRNMYDFIVKMLTKDNANNQHYTNSKSQFILLFTQQNMQIISKKLSLPSISKQTNLQNIGLIKLLVSLLYYYNFVPQNQGKISGKWVSKMVSQSALIFCRQRSKKLSKQQLILFVQLCLQFQCINQNLTAEHKNIEYEVAWDCILGLFCVDNLDKKFAALEVLDTLITQINNRNKNLPQKQKIRLVHNLPDFLHQILNPRNHQQVLNRSTTFLKYWIENVEKSTDLLPVKAWFHELILKCDMRTSTIFGNLWQKLVSIVEFSQQFQLGTIYQYCLEILEIYKIGKNQSTRSRKKIEQDRKQQQMKVLKIVGPLIKKQFHPQVLHRKNVLWFLSSIWQRMQYFSSSLEQMLNQCLFICIRNRISLQFNFQVLQQQITQLRKLIKQHKIREIDANVVTIDEQVVNIYSFITCILISMVQQQADQIQSQANSTRQIINEMLSILTNKQNLSNLIICHNSSNMQQLRELLKIMQSIIQIKNDIQFERAQIQMIINKVDIASQYFLKWVKNRLMYKQNMQFKKAILFKLLRSPSIYCKVTAEALNQLLQITTFADIEQQSKQYFFLNLLKQFNLNNSSKYIYIVLTSLWSEADILSQQWLQITAKKIKSINFSDALEVKFYTEVLKLAEQYNPFTRIKIYSEQIPMSEQVSVKLQFLGEQNFSSVIKCLDSLSLIKIKRQEIDSVVQSQCGSKLLASAIQLNGKLIQQWEYYQSIRKLGSQTNKQNILSICLQNQKLVKLRKVKRGTLGKIVSNLYSKLNITVNVAQICIKRQLKKLHKYFLFQIKDKNIKIQQLFETDLMNLLRKSRELLLDNQNIYKNKQIIVDQLMQLMQQIDSHKLLKVQNTQSSQQTSYTHLNFMSKNSYFMEKAIAVLYENKKQEISMMENKEQDQREDNWIGSYSKKIAFEFINMLILNKQIQSHVCSNMNKFINETPIEEYYVMAFGMEMLWIILQTNQMMKMFVQSKAFNSIFYLLDRYASLLNQIKLEEVPDQQIVIYVRIMVAIIKIFNKVIRLYFLVKQQQYACFITQNPNDMLNLALTKNQLNLISSQQQLNKLISSDKQIQQLMKAKSMNVCLPVIQVNQQKIYEVILKIFMITQKMNNHRQKNNVFLLFYEASRLNCWKIILAQLKKVENQQIIHFLIQSLDSQCRQLALVCQSLLYLYLRINKQNCDKILFNLFQKFKETYFQSKMFYQIFKQSIFVSSNQELCRQIVQSFLFFLMNNQSYESLKMSEVLEQILTVIKYNIKKMPKVAYEAFIQIIVQNYVFHYSDKIKANQPKIRNLAYESILSCFYEHQQLQVESLFNKVIGQIAIANSTEQSIKEKDSGVGLQNLGNICYLNSLMQMLHSIKPFVKQICTIKSQNSLVLGLQKLFIMLSNSLQKSVSPEQFIIAFDPPIDVSIQQDTTQFLTSFIDKLENEDRSGKIRKIVHQFFKGEALSKMSCSSCKKEKDKVEQFIFFSLALENQEKSFKNLQQCIQNTKKPQVIYDVNCQNCKGKRTFNKSTKLTAVPPYLFVHLKRLIFDYKNPYTKVKIHSRLQFGQKISLNGQNFHLKAVITHSGTGQFGHYFTSVKEENGWKIYNDSKVSDFQERNKEQLWFGSPNIDDNNYSTNAYVLLYQKQAYQATCEMIIKQKLIGNQNTQTMKQIQRANQNLLTKQMLFGVNYKKDFVNFAFNLVKLPKTQHNYQKIWQLLVCIGFKQLSITEIPAQVYFSNLEINSELNSILKILERCRQNNHQFLLNRNEKIRQFFSIYVAKMLYYCQNSQTSTIYARSLITNFIPTVKQQKYFINSGQYVKLLSFIVMSMYKYPQISNQLYQSNLFSQMLTLYKNRKPQIQNNFYLVNNYLVQPFVQLMIAFLLLSRNDEQNNIIHNLNPYQQNVVLVRQSLKNDPEYLSLIFLNNSNFQKTNLLFQLLQLNKQNQFIHHLLQIACNIMNKQRQFIDLKTISNFVFLIEYLYKKYYGYSASLRVNFVQAVLGLVFPADVFQANWGSQGRVRNRELGCGRVFSLKERNYWFATNLMSVGYVEMLSRRLIHLNETTKIALEQLQIIQKLLNSFIKIINSDKIFLVYVKNLCCPVALFGNFVCFLQSTFGELQKRLNKNSIIVDCSAQIKQKIKQIKMQIHILIQNIAQYDVPHEQQSILVGSSYKQPTQLLQTVSSNIFVRVQQFSYFYAKYKLNGQSQLIQFVDEDLKLLSQYSKDQSLTKILKQTVIQQIQQQQTTFAGRFNKLKKIHQQRQKIEAQLNQDELLQISHNPTRRKIILSNFNEQSQRVVVQLVCRNMKNSQIQLMIMLQPNKPYEIWVEKKKMQYEWGTMKLYLNGSEINIQHLEMMDNSIQGSSQTSSFHENSMI